MSLSFIALSGFLILAVVGALLLPLFQKTLEENDSVSPTDDLLDEDRQRDAVPHGLGETLTLRLEVIEKQKAAGLLDEEGAEEAILDAKRSVLSSLSGSTDINSNGSSDENLSRRKRMWRFLAVASVGVLPLLATFIYAEVGAPGFNAVMVNEPMVERGSDPAAEAIAQSETIRAMVSGLAARLAENPEDADGWRMLARSQTVLGQHADSVESYRALLQLVPDSVEDWRNFATARATAFDAGDFPYDPEFLEILNEIERLAPGDPMVLFYRGGALRERGDKQGAATAWRTLLNGMPPDAPVLPILNRLIEDLDLPLSDSEGPEALDAN